MTKIGFQPIWAVLIAETISNIGSQITLVALPLTAILFLHASPFQMGLLTGAGMVPSAIFGVFAGTVVDRISKKRALVIVNLLSATLLLLIPLSRYQGVLTLDLVLVVSFVITGLSMSGNIALNSFIPLIVESDRIAQVNATFSSIQSATKIVGPAIAGLLIAVFLAPNVIIIDSISFLISTAVILTLSDKSAPESGKKKSVWDAFAFIKGNSELKTFVTTIMVLNFFGAMFSALQPLFVLTDLNVSSSPYGYALAAGGVGSVLGAASSGKLAGKFELLPLLSACVAAIVISDACICSLSGSPVFNTIFFAFCRIINAYCSTLLGVTLVTFTQKRTPAAKLGSVIGALFTMLGAVTPIGALSGGMLGGVIGVRQTLIFATIGYFAVLINLVTRLFKRETQAGLS